MNNAMSKLFENYPIIKDSFITVARNKLYGNTKCGCKNASRKPILLELIDIEIQFISFKAKCMSCGEEEYYKLEINPNLFAKTIKYRLQTHTELKTASMDAFTLSTELKYITYCEASSVYESEFEKHLNEANKISAKNDRTRKDLERLNKTSFNKLAAI